jgi:hypothetical protein
MHIEDLLNAETRVSQFFRNFFIRRGLECGLNEGGSSFEGKELTEFLHVELFVYDSKTLDVPIYCALHHCTAFQ